MPPRPAKLVLAADIGQGRAAELADGADDRGRLQRFAAVEGEVPDRVALVEIGRRDPGAEAQVRSEAALGDQPVQVARISSRGGKRRLQRQGRNEYEYSCDGTSQHRPG